MIRDEFGTRRGGGSDALKSDEEAVTRRPGDHVPLSEFLADAEPENGAKPEDAARPGTDWSVDSLSEFLDALGEFHNGSRLSRSTMVPWFRGQGDGSEFLVPGILRPGWDPHRERELLRDFKLNALRLVDVPPSSDLEWLAVMQHHRVPTRLLDWTENALAALHFAVEKDDELEHDGVVWILDAWSLNEVAGLGQTVPVVSDPAIASYLPFDSSPDEAIAVRAPRMTARVLAQRGNFTLHGRETLGLAQQKARRDAERLADPACGGSLHPVDMRSIRIIGSSKPVIRAQLRACGITTFSLFPELDGLAEELRFTYRSRQECSPPLIVSRTAPPSQD